MPPRIALGGLKLAWFKAYIVEFRRMFIEHPEFRWVYNMEKRGEKQK